ncbi:MAG TPA: cytochrome P450 [Candidatus Binatia bacterium]|nr:cytochrome P450 [Candidatus Binatia bacterium]
MPATATAPRQPRTAIPKAPLLDTLRALVDDRGQRVDMLSRLQRLHDEKGPVVAQNVGMFRLVYLFGPDANEFVLLDRDRLFSSRRPWMAIMGRIFPNGLLLRDGDEHKQHRRIMHGAFTRPALRQYLERMNPMIARGIDGWTERREPFLAFRAFKELTLDIAASIFVGVELGPKTTRMNGVFEDLVAASMSRLRLPIPGLEFHRGLKGREFMVDYFRRLIPERRAGGGDDMFSRLCRAESEEGERFSDADVIDHMVFLMMAAHDTTTSTLASMTYELARHPEWQARLRDESRAFGRAALEFDDIERLDGLTLVMKETLRRYPPLPVIPRVALREFAWQGYLVPEGAMVVLSPIHTHHMPEWWAEPQRFDPERFTPERAEDEKHTHSWVPFGGGLHLCIGYRFAELQVKSIMHQMLLRYRWTVPDGYRMPVQQAPISKPLDGLPLFLAPV